jgi:hypothetical protein
MARRQQSGERRASPRGPGRGASWATVFGLSAWPRRIVAIALGVLTLGPLGPAWAQYEPAVQSLVQIDGTACGFATALPRSLAKRGSLTAGRTVRVRIDERQVQLEILEAGARVLSRVLPRSPSCAADLDLVVLIIERQSGDLGLVAEDLALPPAPVASPPWDRHLELGLRGGPDIASRIAGDVELVGRLELGRFLELLAGVNVGLPSGVDLVARSGGTASLSSWALGAWLGAGVGLDAGAGRLFLAGTAGVEHTWASATEPLFQRVAQGAWSPTFGAEGRYERALWQDVLWLSFGLGGRFRASAPRFVVEGADAALAVPSATLTGRVGLWARFF